MADFKQEYILEELQKVVNGLLPAELVLLVKLHFVVGTITVDDDALDLLHHLLIKLLPIKVLTAIHLLLRLYATLDHDHGLLAGDQQVAMTIYHLCAQ